MAGVSCHRICSPAPTRRHKIRVISAQIEFLGGTGSLEMLQNPVSIVELAVDKQAATVLMPVSARRALNDLPDEYWTKTNVEFYSEPTDGVFKALME